MLNQVYAYWSLSVPLPTIGTGFALHAAMAPAGRPEEMLMVELQVVSWLSLKSNWTELLALVP